MSVLAVGFLWGHRAKSHATEIVPHGALRRPLLELHDEVLIGLHYHGRVEDFRFSCDAMLGSLARWLRFAGFDTLYEAHVADDTLASEARRQGRWLLTRDRLLASSAGPRVVLLRAESVQDQVSELCRRLPLEIDNTRVFSRCSACNGALEQVAREEVIRQMPPYVAANIEEFRRCSACGRVYWPGTHVTRIQRRLGELFGGGTLEPDHS